LTRALEEEVHSDHFLCMKVKRILLQLYGSRSSSFIFEHLLEFDKHYQLILFLGIAASAGKSFVSHPDHGR
jgi:hypothetical protein